MYGYFNPDMKILIYREPAQGKSGAHLYKSAFTLKYAQDICQKLAYTSISRFYIVDQITGLLWEWDYIFQEFAEKFTPAYNDDFEI
jgi:hypothetical protein